MAHTLSYPMSHTDSIFGMWRFIKLSNHLDKALFTKYCIYWTLVYIVRHKCKCYDKIDVVDYRCYIAFFQLNSTFETKSSGTVCFVLAIP